MLCALLTTAMPLVSQDNVIDEVLWVVGDEAILKSDVEQARLYYMMQGQQIEGEPYCVIPEQLAIQKLFLTQAAIDSVEVTNQEVINAVEAEINDRITRIGSREKMEEYYGMSSMKMREELREIMHDRMVTERMQHKLFEGITVTPSEVRRGYAQLKEEEIPFGGKEYTAQITVTNVAKNSIMVLPLEYVVYNNSQNAILIEGILTNGTQVGGHIFQILGDCVLFS